MRRVITYGTFDLFHQGHYNMLKRAKEEGDYLIVGVTGESYDMERGKLSVVDSLAKRIENVKKTGFADKIIVEEYLGQKIPDIIKYNVDVLVIGSDWKGKFDHLSKYCEVKYLERTKNISSTQLRQETGSIYRLGIVTDELKDHEAVIEPKHVSGYHVSSVFAEDPAIADAFCETYEMDKGYSDYDAFLEEVDIVYIKTPRETREDYTRRALEAGKHVVCVPPITMDSEAEAALSALAAEKKVFLLLDVATVYLLAFGQLLWMTRGHLIGDVVSIRCSISRTVFEQRGKDFLDLAYYPILTLIKCMGYKMSEVQCNVVKNEDGSPAYGVVNLVYPDGVAVAEIGDDIDVKGGMRIIGREGSINVPEDWWEIGYFRMWTKADDQTKRYSSNFEGNGLRYLFQALIEMIREGGDATPRITDEEAAATVKVLQQLAEA